MPTAARHGEPARRRTHLAALAVIACLVIPASLWVSKKQLGGPVDFHHGWLTAHALLSLKAYEDFGLTELAGLSCVIPKTPEWNTDVFADKAKLYVSFPMLHLIAPYAVYKGVNLVAPVALDFPFLQAYHLAANRVLAAVALYFLFFELIGYLHGARFTAPERAILSVGGVCLWLLTPGVLFFSQNVSFSDMAVFTPAFAFCALMLRSGFGRTPGRAMDAGLAVTAFVACGMDWYGYVVCGLGLGLAGLAGLCLGGGGLFARLARAWRAVWPTALGIVLAAGFYVAQLLARGNRFDLLYDRLLHRTKGASHQLKPLAEMLAGIMTHFKMYLPWAFDGLDPLAAGAAVVLAPLALFVPAFALAKRARDGRATAAVLAWLLLCLPPLAHIALLLPHSFIHDFSAEKIALSIPLAGTGLAALAGLLLAPGRGRLAFVTLGMGAAIAVGSAGLGVRYEAFTGHFPELLAYGRYFRDNFARETVLVSDEFPLLAYPNGDNDAVTAWTAKRSVFPSPVYLEYRDQDLVRDTGSLRYLFAADAVRPRDFDICGHLAEEMPHRLLGRTVLGCEPDLAVMRRAALLTKAQVEALPPGPGRIDVLDAQATRQAALTGFSNPEAHQGKPFRWAEGDTSRVVLELAGESTLTMTFQAATFGPDQEIAVTVNGVSAGTFTPLTLAQTLAAVSRNTLEFTAGPGIVEIAFGFSDYNHKERSYVPEDSRRLAARFDELAIELR